MLYIVTILLISRGIVIIVPMNGESSDKYMAATYTLRQTFSGEEMFGLCRYKRLLKLQLFYLNSEIWLCKSELSWFLSRSTKFSYRTPESLLKFLLL